MPARWRRLNAGGQAAFHGRTGRSVHALAVGLTCPLVRFTSHRLSPWLSRSKNPRASCVDTCVPLCGHSQQGEWGSDFAWGRKCVRDLVTLMVAINYGYFPKKTCHQRPAFTLLFSLFLRCVWVGGWGSEKHTQLCSRLSLSFVLRDHS